MTEQFLTSAAIAATVAFLSSVVLTPLIGAIARRGGAVAAPKSDRWHTRPTAMFGGVAIMVAVIGTLLALLPSTREIRVVIAGSVALFLVGLADDLLNIKPYQKLIGQLLGAAAMVSFGLVLPWTASFPLNVLITMFWLVGITNAVNMLDNMDGLAVGVSAIAAAFLGLNFVANQQWPEALMLAAFGGALTGFLIYNHHPASIFMGDCGSMFVGFFLAASALMSGPGGGRSRSVVAVLAVPVLVFLVPIFDTTFVTLMRKMAGRAASQGGRDHTSHRLVALGLSEKRAVWMLYTFAVAAGSLAMLVRQAALDISLGAIASFTLILTFLGVYLARVRVYDDDETSASRPTTRFAFLIDFTYKRRVLEVALDVLLIVLSFYFAHVLVFGPASDAAGWHLFLASLPIAIALKLAALLVSGVYRGLWRFASLADVFTYGLGVALGTVLTIIYVAVIARHQAVALTLSVFIVDAMMLLLAVTASRLAFRALQRLFSAKGQLIGRRVVIYGATTAGELLLRQLHLNPALQRVPVAFLDDNTRKAGRLVHGLPIGAATGAQSIAAFCREHGAEELLIAAPGPSLSLREIVEACKNAGVAVSRMNVDIRELAAGDLE
jgi:UDP-GlcNAc:undecaprenyl-phosphate GlcNAc-1-phosphate transferase